MPTMPATSPKKRSLMPSGALRRSLRGHGHALNPIVQVGKAGVTEGLRKQVEQALADHELIKIKIGSESPEDRFAIADRLARAPGVNIVQILGRVILAYKRHPRTPRFEGKRAKGEGSTGETPGKTTRKAISKNAGKTTGKHAKENAKKRAKPADE